MASINYAHKEIISKIVYYGPGLSGKTTNLQFVFKKIPAETRGELISLATDADRTLYFDFLPVNVGSIQGFSTKFQLYTVPGQVYYNATRKLVLRGVDGIVFVADSQVEKMDENLESFQNLKDNLEEYGYDIDQIPMVIQYNKRDLPNVMEMEELERCLNPKGLASFEAVATTGEGVFRTLKAISKIVLEQIRNNRMGAPRSVKPQAVGVASAAPQGKADSTGTTVDSAPVSAQAVESTHGDLESKESVPGIVKESNTRANVVISDTPEPESKVDEPAVKDDLEETTERSVLKEEVSEKAVEEETIVEARADEIDNNETGEILRGPLYGTSLQTEGFNEEATQIADLNLKNPLPLGVPQMAESRKVKSKRWRFSLFKLFRKSKK